MIAKRGGGYGVAVYDRVLGRKRWVGTFSTKAAAREAEREAASRPRGGGRETCAEFVQRWLRDYARPAPATQSTYKYALQGFARDFGKIRLVELDRPTARAWALGRPQSHLHAVRAMFNDAIDDGLHPGPNPFANLRKAQSRGRRDITALTEPEVEALADLALEVHEDFGHTFRAVVLFAAYVGIRPGELFALERGDVRGDEVIVRQSVDSTGQLKAPKNGKQRIVILPPPAAAALMEMAPRLDLPWLFTSRNGRRFSKTSLTYYWRPLKAAFGRPDLDFYELRHFCATHLLERGVSPADVAVQLGHTDGGALVMSTYGHPSEDLARERLKNAYRETVVPIDSRRVGQQLGSKA